MKRFVEETGSDTVRRLITNSGSAIATATVAYVEVFAGLSRKHRERQMSASDYVHACSQFENEWDAYVQVNMGDEILSLGRDLLKRRALRAFDAIHLASAIFLQRELGEAITFVAADKQLLRAAVAEGLGVIDVEAKLKI